MTVKQLHDGLQLMEEITKLGKVIEDIRAVKPEKEEDQQALDTAIKTLMDKQSALNRKFDEL